MLFNAKSSPSFASFTSQKSFKPSPLKVRKMPQLLWIVFHWHLDHILSGFLSTLVFFFLYSTTKTQTHFEVFSSVNVYTTITTKQAPVQQFRHPKYVLNIIRSDTHSQWFHYTRTGQAFHWPSYFFLKIYIYIFLCCITVSQVPLWQTSIPQCQSQFYKDSKKLQNLQLQKFVPLYLRMLHSWG